MSGLNWLVARPVAHRGLHDAAAGVMENSASAVRAAVAANYAIEVDLQVSADGEAMVHHDAVLGRIVEGDGPLAQRPAAELRRLAVKGGTDRMMTLGDLLDLVAERVTLLLELKSFFDRDRRLAARTAAVLQTYSGPVAVMSFDPAPILAIRELAPALTRGLVAERYDRSRHREEHGSGGLAFALRALRSRPHFLAYSVRDLVSPLPLLTRHVLRRKLLTWTVRREEERRRAERFADQMIFEGFRP
jgi:glycerophosphoryl diester phosphodiesterase